jgi:UbiD family decarboxylase
MTQGGAVHSAGAETLGLREYIEVLRAIGELQAIDREVDRNLEIGAVTRRIYETGGPAALFNRIKGIEPGFLVLGAPAGVSARPDQPMARVDIASNSENDIITRTKDHPWGLLWAGG